VPAKIIAVPDIPRTISAKIVELAVRNVVHGLPVKIPMRSQPGRARAFPRPAGAQPSVTLADAYRRELAAQGWRPDAAQAAAIARLEELRGRLRRAARREARLLWRLRVVLGWWRRDGRSAACTCGARLAVARRG